ncbi:hypothetical protein [Streptomyces sp. B1I3]|nr:hypothetical protein [Streptomyces sp. B1I3]
MFGSGDLTVADQAARASIHRARQAAKQADAAKAKRETATKATSR